MSEESQVEQHIGEPSNPLRPRRRRWPFAILLVVLALAAAGGVYAWANFGRFVQSFARETSDGAGDLGEKTAVPDLLAAQQKTSEDLEILSEKVGDQQEQLKTVTEQLAAVAAKMDALQRPVPVQVPRPDCSCASASADCADRREAEKVGPSAAGQARWPRVDRRRAA
jgi:hypothetical protein